MDAICIRYEMLHLIKLAIILDHIENLKT